MQVSSDVVGKKLKQYTAEISQRQISNYAAAVGDLNPCYLDDERKEGLIAPPTMASAITWPIIQNLGDYVDLGYPPEALFQLVHYSEQLTIHRPVQVGDSLSITGEVAAVLPRKSGTHVIFKLPALDKNGDAVFTEYIGGLLRGVECPDGGRGAEKVPAPVELPEEAKFSGPAWEVSLPVTRKDCYIYDGCADVPFPIHTSPAFARGVGLPGIIYQGIATLAQAVRELTNRELYAEPARIGALSCFFRGMVVPDSFIRVQLLKRSEESMGKSLFFRVLNAEGKEAVSEGFLNG